MSDQLNTGIVGAIGTAIGALIGIMPTLFEKLKQKPKFMRDTNIVAIFKDMDDASVSLKNDMRKSDQIWHFGLTADRFLTRFGETLEKCELKPEMRFLLCNNDIMLMQQGIAAKNDSNYNIALVKNAKSAIELMISSKKNPVPMIEYRLYQTEYRNMLTILRKNNDTTKIYVSIAHVCDTATHGNVIVYSKNEKIENSFMRIWNLYEETSNIKTTT
ncbi:hypothetical protein AGMMS49992_33670 [Clostridia bacterium]|nr:hypothetical protein AGMMS49992_33670 [Clostridia bacterium]